MAIQKLEEANVDYLHNTFYIYKYGELKAVYFSIYDEKLGSDRKIIGIDKNNTGTTRYMSPKSFEKKLKTWMNNDKFSGGTMEVYSEYDAPSLWITKVPPVMKGCKTIAKKTTTRKTIHTHKPVRKTTRRA